MTLVRVLLVVLTISIVSIGSFDSWSNFTIDPERSSIFYVSHYLLINAPVTVPIDLYTFLKKYIFTGKCTDKYFQGSKLGGAPPWAERLMCEYAAAIQRLEGEINKAFEPFRCRISVSCSEFLKGLDVTPVCTHIFKTYRGEEWRFRHNPTFMIKAATFMKLRGIKFQTGLVRHLRDNPKEAEDLGCRFSPKGNPVLPSRRAFNHFMSERLTKEVWGLIDFIAERSKEMASEKGILLNFAVARKPARKA